MNLPPVLASDPWPKRRVRAVLALEPIEHAAMAWPAGERERILDEKRVAAWEDVIAKERDPRAHALKLLLAHGIVPLQAGHYLELADLPTLARSGLSSRFVEHYALVRLPLAKHGLDALPALFEVFTTWPEDVLVVLAFVDATAVGRFLLEDAYQYEGAFLHWASARSESAALVLLPLALGPDGKRRDAAVKLLLRMRGGARPPRGKNDRVVEAAVRAAAARYGELALAELETLYAPPPLPSKPPKLPKFVELDTLPSPKLVDGTAIVADAKRRLVQLAALLPADAARKALDEAIPTLDPDSLAELADAVLSAWTIAGAPAKERWVLLMSARFGDDRAVRKLSARAHAWSTEGHPARGKLALEAISAIGSDVALMHLSILARGKSALKKHAEKLLARFGKEHDLTEDEVADRTVPDLGLDDRGSLVLDFGSRTFRVGFDEQLRPFVLDDAGNQLSALPRVTKADDAAMGSAAQELWESLKLETKSVGAEQMRRLERAMVTGRLWSARGFRQYFLEHPLMRHLARRLVWGTFDPAATPFDPTAPPRLLAPFRIAEDGTFANVDDDTFTLAGDAWIGLVHPLLVSTDVRQRFVTSLADYGIVQPFLQLDRELYFATDQECSASSTNRYVDKLARGERFFALRYRGWRFDGYEIGKEVGPSIEAIIHTEPGLAFRKPEDQTLGEVELRRSSAAYAADDAHADAPSAPSAPSANTCDGAAPTFAALTPIAASELFRDLDSLLR